MEWKDVQVSHRFFGPGRVVKCEDGYLTVFFQQNGMEKTFSYPRVFRDFLTTRDADALSHIQQALNEAERAEEKERLKKMAKLASIRKEAADEKAGSKSSRTTSAKAKVKKA